MQNRFRIAALSSSAIISLLPAAAFAEAPSKASQVAADTTAVSEVLVTARKVTERAQDVPIPITAIGHDQLEASGRVNTQESLNNIAPGVKVFRAANQSDSYAVFIRGFGRDNGFPHVEAPVATYVDDVNYPFQVGPTLNLGDISRVEVLRGPQGTLYGRSATVGAVKYYTTRPSLTDPTYDAQATYGTFNRQEVVVGAGMPLDQNTAGVRFELGYHHTDGDKTDRRTGQKLGGTDGFSGRLSLLWKPTDNVEVFVSADGSRDRDQADPVTAQKTLPDGEVVPLFGSNYIVESHPTDPHLNSLDVGGATAQVTYDLHGLVLKSISAYRQDEQIYSNDFNGRADVAYTGSVVDARVHYWTQEFQATGKALNDRLSYVGGLFFLGSDVEVVQQSPGAANKPTYTTNQNSFAVALYTDATYNFTEKLAVSGGIRYSYDTKTVDQNVVSTTSNFGKTNVDNNWSNWSPRVGVDYKITDDVLAYASFSKGYKTGALSSLTPAVLAAAAVFIPPETVDDTEFGVKSEWFEKRLRLNVGYFIANYKNQTTAALDARQNNFLITNDVDARGLEVEFVARPIHNFFFAGSMEQLDAQYVNISPTNTTILALADKHPKHTPKITYNLRTGYTFENVFNSEAAIVLGAEYNHFSYTWECLAHNPACLQPKYGVADVHATYIAPNGRLQFILAGSNVGNTEYSKLGGNNVRNFLPRAEYSFTVRYKY